MQFIYRPCVGIAVFNREGLVFIGRRRSRRPIDSVAPGYEWQMPQGGIDPGEPPHTAALRELAEETSISSVSLLAEVPQWLSYDLPTDLSRKFIKGRFRGQTQKWFAFRFEGRDDEINIEHPVGGHKPEFDAWRWEKIERLPELIIPFKREVYESVVDYFRPLAEPTADTRPSMDSRIGRQQRAWASVAALGVLLALAPSAAAQEMGTLDPSPLPPLSNPGDPKLPAKQLFGRVLSPAELQSRSIGFYAKGCLAGAEALPINGPAWQVMRLSRNRNWGNPALIAFLERFAKMVPSINGWPGLLVGDVSQPRGGPMLNGHASHQIGLDADIWLTPMPDHTLSRAEREFMTALNVVRPDGLSVDRTKWTPEHLALIEAAAEQPEVERIFVNPAIKKAICEEATGNRSWLTKVRPMYGHNYHFHVRIKCPAGNSACESQAPVPPGDGCNASLAHWFTPAILHPRLDPHWKRPPGIPVAALPPACRQVLLAK